MAKRAKTEIGSVEANAAFETLRRYNQGTATRAEALTALDVFREYVRQEKVRRSPRTLTIGAKGNPIGRTRKWLEKQRKSK